MCVRGHRHMRESIYSLYDTIMSVTVAIRYFLFFNNTSKTNTKTVNGLPLNPRKQNPEIYILRLSCIFSYSLILVNLLI